MSRSLAFVVPFACASSFAFALAACGDDDANVPPADAGVTDGAAGGGDAGAPPGVPDRYCPGSTGCADMGDGVLSVGVGKAEITPTIGPMTDVQTVDVNMNGEYDPGDGDTFADNNHNGAYDGEWIAGFGNGRAASGVRDPQWVRAIALRYDQTTIVLAAIDCIGYFRDEIEKIRARVSDADVDFVQVTATHVHEARDTLGIWGVTIDATGIDPAYMTRIVDQAEVAIRAALADLRPASVQYASLRLKDEPGGQTRYVVDARDPYILDDEVRVMRFTDRTGGGTIATLVNWGSHPEYTWSESQLLSSDYVHTLRQGIEDGVVGQAGTMLPGVGGTTVFFQGALGVQIGASGPRPQAQRWDGTPVPRGPDMAYLVGEQVASFVLEALGPSGGSVTDETAALAFRSRAFLVDVQNRGYHIALLQSLFQRATYAWDPELALVPGRNEPSILTEVSIIDIGRAQIITAPGELDPALFLGGYQSGEYTPAGTPVVSPTGEDPPDLTIAPGPPYLRDLARSDAEYVYLFGLTGDMVGYFVPEFDYKLDPTNPYIDQAPGEHYEETNSVGIDGWPNIRRQMEGLLTWRPAP